MGEDPWLTTGESNKMFLDTGESTSSSKMVKTSGSVVSGLEGLTVSSEVVHADFRMTSFRGVLES